MFPDWFVGLVVRTLVGRYDEDIELRVSAPPVSRGIRWTRDALGTAIPDNTGHVVRFNLCKAVTVQTTSFTLSHHVPTS